MRIFRIGPGDVYLGGGVGGGGYRYSMAGSLTPAAGPGPGVLIASDAQVASFAWLGGGRIAGRPAWRR